jgi:hypothetical protein
VPRTAIPSGHRATARYIREEQAAGQIGELPDVDETARAHLDGGAPHCRPRWAALPRRTRSSYSRSSQHLGVGAVQHDHTTLIERAGGGDRVTTHPGEPRADHGPSENARSRSARRSPGRTTAVAWRRSRQHGDVEPDDHVIVESVEVGHALVGEQFAGRGPHDLVHQHRDAAVVGERDLLGLHVRRIAASWRLQ